MRYLKSGESKCSRAGGVFPCGVAKVRWAKMGRLKRLMSEMRGELEIREEVKGCVRWTYKIRVTSGILAFFLAACMFGRGIFLLPYLWRICDTGVLDAAAAFAANFRGSFLLPRRIPRWLNSAALAGYIHGAVFVDDFRLLSTSQLKNVDARGVLLKGPW